MISSRRSKRAFSPLHEASEPQVCWNKRGRYEMRQAGLDGCQKGQMWPFFLRRGNARSMGRFQTKREVLLQMVPRLMNDTRRRTLLLFVSHISLLPHSKIGEIPLLDGCFLYSISLPQPSKSGSSPG